MKLLQNLWRLLKLAVKEFSDDQAMKLSASLAYYTVFAIGPLILVIISIAGVFIGQSQISVAIYNELRSGLGPATADFILGLTDSLRLEKKASVYTAMGLITLFLGATSVFSDIQNSINYIFSIKAKPKKGWVKFITNRLISFVLVLSLGLILMLTLFINALSDLLTKFIERWIPQSDWVVIKTTNFLLLFVLLALLFTIIYKVLPDAIIRFKDALVGACFTTALFIVGKELIGYYLSTQKFSITYGAATSVILLLLWVYYSSAILYFGAEFTKVYAIEYGAGIKVYSNAVFIEKREVRELPFKLTEGTTVADNNSNTIKSALQQDSPIKS